MSMSTPSFPATDFVRTMSVMCYMSLVRLSTNQTQLEGKCIFLGLSDGILGLLPVTYCTSTRSYHLWAGKLLYVRRTS